jgi:hypothetical protein
MQRFLIQAEPALWLLLMLLASCGDAAVPQAPFDAATPDASVPIIDATPPADTCSCTAQGMASRVGFNSYAREIYDNTGAGNTCNPEYSNGRLPVAGELLGAGSVLEEGPNEYKAWLKLAGVWWYDIFPRDSSDESAFLAWFGGWRAPERDVGNRMITSAACLLPAESGAECAREAWLSYTVETATLGPQQQMDLRVACADGLLVAGGCTPRPETDDNMAIVRAGFAPDNRDEWLCSFVNQDAAIASDVMSLAFCLHENPLPAECGCCPSLADSITIKQETAPLRFGANRLQVQCDPGQFLVLGNCMIDVPSAADVADVTMFRFGYPPTAEHPDGDHSTWGCSWYNPTGNTPRAIATAVCLPGE